MQPFECMIAQTLATAHRVLACKHDLLLPSNLDLQPTTPEIGGFFVALQEVSSYFLQMRIDLGCKQD
jgi:hypothetical protein